MTSDHPFVLYLREVAALPPLAAAAETQLIALIREGGRDAETAKKKLIEAHLFQVVSIANQYSQDPSRLLDLITDGNIGLMRAAEKLDDLGDVRFSAHATPYIRKLLRMLQRLKPEFIAWA
jgi:RNA polymerase primary sigma factor